MAGEYDSTMRRYQDRVDYLASADYVLTLFVTGASELSVRAIRNVRQLCETYLHGRYELAVVDIYREPGLMRANNVVAAPTLVRQAPLPQRMLVGDLSNLARVLAVLDVRPPVATGTNGMSAVNGFAAVNGVRP